MGSERNWTMQLPAQSPNQLLAQMSRLYVISRAVHAVAELGVANLVDDNPASAKDVAARAGLNEDFLARTMAFLASYGIFEQTSSGYFRATELSRLLRDDHPRSMRAMLRMVSNDWWNAAGHLAQVLREGRSGMEIIHNTGFFDFLATNADLQQRFDEGMSNISQMDDAVLVKSYEFSQAKVVVDLAGGKGGFLREILVQNPGLTGILFDQPNVLSGGTLLDELVAKERARLVSGNLFETLPAPADVYVLKGTLHDFSDEDALRILRSCATTMSRKDKLLVIEQIIPEGSGPHPNRTMDMVMMFLLGGRQRSVADWTALLKVAGFEISRTIPTDTIYTCLEATPAT